MSINIPPHCELDSVDRIVMDTLGLKRLANDQIDRISAINQATREECFCLGYRIAESKMLIKLIEEKIAKAKIEYDLLTLRLKGK